MRQLGYLRKMQGLDFKEHGVYAGLEALKMTSLTQIKRPEFGNLERSAAVKVFAESPSYGQGMACPLCKTRNTQPVPGCWCPSELKWGVGPFTRHIMKEHHRCMFQKQFRNMCIEPLTPASTFGRP
jgi:hypothetical protein